MYGRVVPGGEANRIRNASSTGGAQVGRLEAGERFRVLDGPVCGDGYAWLEVEYAGGTGWTVESDNEDYWLEPLPGRAAFEADACIVSTSTTVNKREQPNVNAPIVGQTQRDDLFDVVGTTTDEGGFVWWNLGDGAWLRDDTVTREGNCNFDEERAASEDETVVVSEDEALTGECTPVLPSRLTVDMAGYVLYDLGLFFRDTVAGERIASLDFGTTFTTLAEPECRDNVLWWFVALDSGEEGWLVESSTDYYLLAPTDLEAARLPIEYDTQCPNALPSQLSIGTQAEVITGGLRFFRSPMAANEYPPIMDESTIVEVLGGPACEGNNSDILRWYVRVIEGDDNQIGYEGWIAEADSETRLIVPVTD